MKATLLLLCSAALVAHSVDVREVATTLKYAPPAETELRTTWLLDWELESTQVAIPSLGIPDFDTPLRTSGKFVWSALSALESPKGERPGKITRTYDEAERAIVVEMPSGSGFPGARLDDSGTTLPIDVEVLFEANDDGYNASFPSKDGGVRPTSDMERLLDGLTARLDAAAWLDLGAREPGDEWEVPGDNLASLWFASAKPADWFWLDRAQPAESFELNTEVADVEPGAFSYDVMGAAEAQYLGLEDIEGVECARIELTFDDHVEMVVPSITSLLARLAEDTPVPFESAPLKVDAQLEGTGVLLWDIKANRLVSITFETQAVVDMTFGIWINMGTAAAARYIEYQATLEGPLNWSLTEVEE